ncbi:MAG: EI24 domain-containing protein [Flavobacteriaceae bacterium]|jgi:CysZ protein|nr:EI24 domain-containing protein [Flavobacteriaceae bacterium]MDG1422547.1 EI24 domain-containing protein [Flavobacteriaceae bacterium]MDG1980348.1 EI24 domain-containing protein [Flavobacteriaceae bacterium]|tara:strand:- start:5170 stop:5901 length:732 start_codon:yes stop_codon:yes gene_type:complete
MLKGVYQGCSAYSEVYEIISRLKLWKFFVIPMLISFLVFSMILVVSFSLSSSIGSYIASFWSWDFGQETIHAISRFFGGLLIIIFGFISFKHIIMALSAPFMGPISKIIEDDINGVVSQVKTSTPSGLLMRGIRISLRNLLRELVLSIPILLFGLIPVVGFFSVVMLFLMQAYFAGFGNMDYTLERHFSYQKSVFFVKKNKGIAMGNGIVFMLFLLIPFLGVILVHPLSVTAATIVTVKSINK